MKVNVSNIQVKDLTPKLKDPALKKYLPTVLFPKHISFEIEGVSNAISNALRRTVACELQVRAMNTEYGNVKTTDMHIIPEMIIKRLRMIPIDQSVPVGSTFELIAVNNTALVRDVKSGEIKGGSSKLFFNQTFTICTLQPGKSIKITDIRINQAYGYTSGDGMHVLACNAASIALDQQPINMYESDINEPHKTNGLPCRLSDPRKWKVSFNTNGSMESKAIVVAACDNIIMRIDIIKSLLYSIENNGDEYILQVPGESDTIGNLFMKTISELFPKIIAVTYSVSSISRDLAIRVRCDEDINNVYGATIKYLVAVFTAIRSNFE